MNIKEITVTATATKQYNKFEVSLTAEIIDDNDFETLKNIAINKALSGVDQLVENSSATPEVKVQSTPVQPPVRRESYPTAPVQRPATPSYYSNSPVHQANTPHVPVQTPNGPKMASEKQVNLLKKYRYQLDWSTLTAEQANLYIKECLGDRSNG
jgi:hypothetical protein